MLKLIYVKFSFKILKSAIMETFYSLFVTKHNLSVNPGLRRVTLQVDPLRMLGLMSGNNVRGLKQTLVIYQLHASTVQGFMVSFLNDELGV